MLIIANDIPMPQKSCYDCPCVDSENGSCQADKEQRYIDFNIPKWCPLRELVRCKDCKHRYVDGDNVRFNVCELNHNKVQSEDWFCADGERKDERS